MVMIGLVLIEKRDQGNRERVSCSLWMEFDATVYFWENHFQDMAQMLVVAMP